ncbi:hypothetical protein ABH926_003252 [Catenulispora sp. GP43]
MESGTSTSRVEHTCHRGPTSAKPRPQEIHERRKHLLASRPGRPPATGSHGCPSCLSRSRGGRRHSHGCRIRSGGHGPVPSSDLGSAIEWNAHSDTGGRARVDSSTASHTGGTRRHRGPRPRGDPAGSSTRSGSVAVVCGPTWFTASRLGSLDARDRSDGSRGRRLRHHPDRGRGDPGGGAADHRLHACGLGQPPGTWPTFLKMVTQPRTAVCTPARSHRQVLGNLQFPMRSRVRSTRGRTRR